MGVKTIFSSNQFSENRGRTEDGRKIYSLSDAYPHADLVTYPSLIEGFGNAFLEALYYKKPIVVNNYSIFATDIRPKGFKVIEFDEYITEQTVQATLQVLDDPEHQAQICDYNYELALRHYSYRLLRNQFKVLLANAFGINGE
jgi:glycosyltransferase involved in cell wall biosynthesis